MDNETKSTSAIAATQVPVSTTTSSTSTTPVSAPSTSSATTTTIATTTTTAQDGAQDLMVKTRKLQLEIEEKNEIINILKDELETLREQSDKYQRENLKLVKDAKRVNYLQDENDFLQDKVGSVEKLELEIKRLKEKLNELDFLKLRVKELEDDRNKAQEEFSQAETLRREAESKLGRIPELESEVNKWKSFSHELERVRDSIQSKLLESIEQETKLSSDNKKVEDEVKRLRDLVKTYEEQRDEEQASTSLKSVGTEVMFAVNQELVGENENLKEELKKKESSIEKIRDELEGNRKLISDLRQDLACEKSLAEKLTNQLAQFTKQIKNLDKQYFPMHDPQMSNDISNGESNKCNSTKTVESVPTPIPTKETTTNHDKASPVPPQEVIEEDDENDKNSCPQVSKEDCSPKRTPTPQTSEAKVCSTTSPKTTSNFVRNSLPSRSVNFGHSKSVAYLDRIRASVSATTKTNTLSTYSKGQSTQRNVLMTSSTSATGQPLSTSATQQTRNDTNNTAIDSINAKNVLNCMLNHDHTERCYISADSVAPAQVQVYGGGQQIPLNPSIPLPHPFQNPHNHNHYHHNPLGSHQSGQANHQNTTGAGSPSRQLNALIDPVAHEQLFLSMLQQQGHHQQQQANHHAQHQQHQLTEQQIAHLNNLHRQHYYHHLHELYQMHHQHHMHLHHLHQHQYKCPQQQHNPSSSQAHQSPRKQMPKIVGSQFQAPIYVNQNGQQQQVYANMESSQASRVNQLNEQRVRPAVEATSTLVNNSSNDDNLPDNGRNLHQQLRKSPQRFSSCINGNLPQIDEGNGLQTVAPEVVARNNGHIDSQHLATNTMLPSNNESSSKKKSNSASQNQRGPTATTANGSPLTSASSSPTSSRTSSNSSPSSSTSLDSLSASGCVSRLLNRSATSQHSASDLNRRQFSIEREIVGQSPMTAKLSRVGSCRGFPSQPQSQISTNDHHHQVIMDPVTMNGLPSPRMDSNGQQFLRNPAKTQQPPLKHTSKILNIGVQQQQASTAGNLGPPPLPPPMGQIVQRVQGRSPETSSPGRYKQLNQLASNLADIKLNDNLAFSSFRAPKKSSSGSNLLNSSLDGQRVVTSSSKVQQTTSCKQHQQEQRSISSNGDRGNSGGGDNNNNNTKSTTSDTNSAKSKPNGQAAKSSVWFEYGCV